MLRKLHDLVAVAVGEFQPFSGNKVPEGVGMKRLIQPPFFAEGLEFLSQAYGESLLAAFAKLTGDKRYAEVNAD